MRQGSVALKVTVIGYIMMTMSGATDREASSAASSGVRLMVRENGRLLVPVAVNGKKESRFLFDTGATTSVLSEKLAAKAGVTPKSMKRVSTFAGAVSLPVGQVDTVRIGDRSVIGIEVIVADLARLFNLDSDIDGILGQDVLSRFNYLLDRRKGKLEIEEGGNLSSSLSGNRVACEKRGGKTLVPVAGGQVNLMLDSGNPYLVVYDDAVSRLHATANVKDEKEVRSSIGSRKIRAFRIDSLQIGDSIKRNVEAYLATRSPGGSEDGFLPLFVFDSIYVNNLENFLIANPKRAWGGEKEGRLEESVGKKVYREFAEIENPSLDHYLRTIRPSEISADLRKQVIANLPREGELKPSAEDKARLSQLQPIFSYHDRAPIIEIRVIDVPQAFLGLHASFVLLIARNTMNLLTAEELQAAVAHEMGHSILGMSTRLRCETDGSVNCRSLSFNVMRLP